jgi:hypothetical protein
MGDY